MHTRAACLIIGDEILSGRTRDSNGAYIAQKLSSKGIELKEIRVIADDKNTIANAAIELSSKFDYVFATGGIGPTHDDITCDSIAQAFNLPVEINNDALNILQDYYKSRNQEMNEGRLRMARVPKGAKLILNNLTAAPGFIVKNIYVMAGVPKIMQYMLENALQTIPRGQALHQYSIKIYSPESVIAAKIAGLQEKYEEVKIGSYPQNSGDRFYTEIVARSYNKAALSKIESELEIIAKNIKN